MPGADAVTDQLAWMVNLALVVGALAVLAMLLVWLWRIGRRMQAKALDAAWADVTERARDERVPITAEDSIKDIEERIRSTREKRLRKGLR